MLLGVLALRQRVDEDRAVGRQALDVFAGDSGWHGVLLRQTVAALRYISLHALSGGDRAEACLRGGGRANWRLVFQRKLPDGSPQITRSWRLARARRGE